MTTLSRAEDPIPVPVLKMPPERALSSLRILASPLPEPAKRAALTALSPGIKERTSLYAYALPSLTELGLYEGTLRNGHVTPYGAAVAKAKDDAAKILMARQLLDIDVDRVGFVAWLGERGPHGESKLTGLKRFCAQRLGVSETLMPRAIDRLGKWVGYLICFDVVQETSGPPAYWCVSTRHVSALHKVTAATDNAAGVLTRDQERDALLGAYSSASQQLGTKLYVPIHNLRESLGLELALPEAPLLNSQLDDILRRAPALLDDYTVTFSPFSGPARGGLEIPGMYAGYMSVRLRAPAPRKAPRGRKDG